MSLHYLPPVKPSAIAAGTLFTHSASLLANTPIFGDAFKRARRSETRDEFIRSREATSAVTVWSSSLLGSGLQTYAVAALINLTGTYSYKAAAYLGGLVFTIASVPGLVNGIFLEARPLETVAVKTVSSLVETVGLALALTWWGTRTQPTTRLP